MAGKKIGRNSRHWQVFRQQIKSGLARLTFRQSNLGSGYLQTHKRF
jgi:hypothetical protein